MGTVATIQELLQDHQRYHSNMQIDRAIVGHGGGPHPYGQYRQCLRELHSRFVNARRLHLEQACLDAEIEDLQEAPESEGSKAKLQRARKRALKLLELEETQSRLKDSCRELGRFLGLSLALKEQVGELTPRRRDELDLEAWRETLKLRAALDSLAGGRPSRSTFEAIMLLPPAEKRGLLAECVNVPGLLTWVELLDMTPPEPISIPEPQSMMDLLQCLSS